MICDTQSAQISHRLDERNIYAIMKIMIPAMCNRTSCAQVHELPQTHYGDNREGTLFS